jgi:hypothetical protein
MTQESRHCREPESRWPSPTTSSRWTHQTKDTRRKIPVSACSRACPRRKPPRRQHKRPIDNRRLKGIGFACVACPRDPRPVPARDQPDQSAQSIRLGIKSRKIRRRNLPFAKRGEYLSVAGGDGPPTRSSDGRGFHSATPAKPGRRALKTHPITMRSAVRIQA